MRALTIASRRLKLDRMGERQAARVQLFQGSLAYTDKRLKGYDAAVLSEVIEHLDLPRLPALEYAVFGSARPRTVLVTTPNVEYNVRWETLPAGHVRHGDHRFEWTRAEFRAWADTVAERHGYDVGFVPVGPDDPEVGPPTQMAVFTRVTATTEQPGPRRRRRRTRHDRDPGFPAQRAGPARHRPLPRRAVGASGSGKSTFAATALQADRGDLLATSAAAWSPTTRTTRAPAGTPSTSCTTSRASGWRPAGAPSSTPPACSRTARRQLIDLAKQYDVLPIAIVLDVPEEVCAERNAARADRADMPRRVIQRHIRELRRSLRHLEREGFRKVHVLRGVEEVESGRGRHREALQRPDPPHRPVRHHRRHPRLRRPNWRHCCGRLGYVDGVHPRGPYRGLRRRPRRPRPGQPGRAAPGDVAWSRSGNALCVPGNHENKYGRHLKGRRSSTPTGSPRPSSRWRGRARSSAGR